MNDLTKNRYKDTYIDLIIHGLKAMSLKSALQSMAEHTSVYAGVSAREILTGLQDPQIMATAALGGGAAIPNVQLSDASRAFTVLARLDKPIKFKNAPDSEPVDIICLLVSPESDGPVHLRRLARLSRMLLNKDMRQKIRTAQNEEFLHMVVNKTDGWLVAA